MPNDNTPTDPKDDGTQPTTSANPNPSTLKTPPDPQQNFTPGVPGQDDFPSQTITQSPSESTSSQGVAASEATVNAPQEPEIITAPHAPKKYGGTKIIATIFGILLLIGGVTAGVILVQRQQQIAEKATSGAECQQNPNCILLENPGNSGTYDFPRTIKAVQITAREVWTYMPGLTEDGCYKVNIEGRTLTWQKSGEGPNCKDISNIQAKLEETGEPTNTPTLPEATEPPQEPTSTPKVTEPPTPGTTAKCGEVKAYDTSWKLLTQTQLNGLEAGNKVRFAVAGTASSGSFDKAKFSVNGTNLGETSLKKPASDEFYVEYTIPANTTSFTVGAQVHHSELGWF